MLTVIKRSGDEEPFDPQKLENSLAAASDELGEPLGQGDIHLILSSVLRSIETKRSVSSKEIYELIVKSIEEAGFEPLARAYRSYTDNHWA